MTKARNRGFQGSYILHISKGFKIPPDANICWASRVRERGGEGKYKQINRYRWSQACQYTRRLYRLLITEDKHWMWPFLSASDSRGCTGTLPFHILTPQAYLHTALSVCESYLATPLSLSSSRRQPSFLVMSLGVQVVCSGGIAAQTMPRQ